MSSHIAGLVTLVAEDTEDILLVALAAAATAGIVTGALYRVGAAIVASFVTIIAVGIIGFGEGWSFWRIGLTGFGLITALQVGYLLGVALVFSGDRVRGGVPRAWRRVAAPDEDAQGKSAGTPPEG